MRKLLLAVAVAAGCGGAEPMTMEPVRDLRLAIPAADPKYIDFVGLDGVIMPGEDKMLCLHMRYDGETTAFNYVDAQQSKFGHHFVLIASKEPKPPGTMEDCSKPEDMAKFDPFAIPSDILPTGFGFALKQGQPLVAQSHYINSSKQPILIRDIIRLTRMDPKTVTTWTAPFTTIALDLNVPAQGTAQSTFDCVVPEDLQLMFVVGHMHEWGSRFELKIGADARSLTSLYKVDNWVADFRDNPPASAFFKNPLALPKGSVVQTHCQWKSDQDHALIFPHEMCVAAGVVAGRKDPWVCKHGEGANP